MSSLYKLIPRKKWQQVMDIRRPMCKLCREKLPNINDVSLCPACQRVNPDRPKSSINGSSSEEDGRRLRCRKNLSQFAQKVYNRISRQGGSTDIHGGSNVKPEDQYESLNYCSGDSSSSGSLSRKSGAPRKRALIIGVTYKKWKYKLKGTLNDVKRMREWLIKEFQFPPENIRVLTEREPDQNRTPTKKNILESLNWLVEDCQSGDSLVFYYSGHGVRQPDFDSDEMDGFDETICPVDFMEHGVILDDEINSTIVWPLTEGVTLHAFIDACHSGTMLDLEYLYNRQRKEWEDNKPPSGIRKHTNGGLAISLCACEDKQVAADTSAFGNGDEMNGAMTYLLTQIWNEHSGVLSYGVLLDTMYELIAKANNDGSALTKFLRRLFRIMLVQRPLLSASSTFPVYDTELKL